MLEQWCLPLSWCLLGVRSLDSLVSLFTLEGYCYGVSFLSKRANEVKVFRSNAVCSQRGRHTPVPTVALTIGQSAPQVPLFYSPSGCAHRELAVQWGRGPPGRQSVRAQVSCAWTGLNLSAGSLWQGGGPMLPWFLHFCLCLLYVNEKCSETGLGCLGFPLWNVGGVT